MKEWFELYPSLFDDAAISGIINPAMKVEAEPALSGGIVNPNQRRSEVRWLRPNNPDFRDLFARLYGLFHQANRKTFGFDITYLPALQFTTYDGSNNGFFDWHNDIFWKTDGFYQRKLSMVIQLTDPSDYSGGTFEFADGIGPDQEALRKKGSVLVFPSFQRHRVAPVTAGVRRSLVGWIEGPLWR